jgi:hypothetical protein
MGLLSGFTSQWGYFLTWLIVYSCTLCRENLRLFSLWFSLARCVNSLFHSFLIDLWFSLASKDHVIHTDCKVALTSTEIPTS